MKPHKHAELIKAWADGATIEYRVMVGEGLSRWSKWFVADPPNWSNDYDTEYRIKPEPKPDVVKYLIKIWNQYGCMWIEYDFEQLSTKDNKPIRPQQKITIDGETGELKSAEVLK